MSICELYVFVSKDNIKFFYVPAAFTPDMQWLMSDTQVQDNEILGTLLWMQNKKREKNIC